MAVVGGLEADLFCGALLCEVGSVDPEAQVLLTLAVGALICVKPVVWAPEAGFSFVVHFFCKAGVLGLQARVVSSLDVGVLIV